MTTTLCPETLTRSGGAGENGLAGTSPGDSGENGKSGESLSETLDSPNDADKTLNLTGGKGGLGGIGGASLDAGSGGSGGSGGNGGSVRGTVLVSRDETTQSISMVISGGSGGLGGNGASDGGNGGRGGPGGDASANATMIAGPSTAIQNATLNLRGGSSRSAGAGSINPQIEPRNRLGGAGGRARAAGNATANVTMTGSTATTTQQLNLISVAGSNGLHGTGTGISGSLQGDPVHPVASDVAVNVATPAENASVNVSVLSRGGNGMSRPDFVAGGPMASRGRIRASRIDASGANSSITANFTAEGGTSVGYIFPNLGPIFVPPGDFPAVGRGASPMAEPIDLVAGANGTINASLSLTGGNGGGSDSPFRSGDGGRVEFSEPLLRAISGGGNVTLRSSANAGSGGSAGTANTGTGGHATLVNTLSVDTPTGQVSLTQNANGGHLGGRATSFLEIDGTTDGILSVTANAVGGKVSNGSFLTSSLGSGEATSIVRGIGSSTTANAAGSGSTAANQISGAFAKATADATGPSTVRAISIARAGKGNFHGKSTATSTARVTQPGTVAFAQTSTNGDSGEHNAVAVADGDPLLPVSWLVSTYHAGRISRGNSEATNAAAAGANLLVTAFANTNSRAASLDDQNPTQRQQTVNGPFTTNPVPKTFFDNLADEKHLISVRFNQNVNALAYPPGATTTHRHGGAFRLREGMSGGSLVMSGLGFTSSGGGFDSGLFRFLKDGDTLIETSFADTSEAAAVFSNQTFVLADLTNADAGNVFSWEVEIITSAATQAYDGTFLLSATLDSGLPMAAPATSNARLSFSELRLTTDLSDPFAPLNLFSGTITGAPAFSRIFIDASIDLGLTDPWTLIRILPTGIGGNVALLPIANPANPGAEQLFIRARTD